MKLPLDRLLWRLESLLPSTAGAQARLVSGKMGEFVLELPHGRRIIIADPTHAEQLVEVGTLARAARALLIEGETGVGKESVALLVHVASGRTGALCPCNCATISVDQAEGELFGVAEGAFTNVRPRNGLFRNANSGTVFLDEVGELDLHVQTKLLRVLQEGEFSPLGSDETVGVDVKVVAATNRDLRTAVARGLFREDLYYRLSAATVVLPPLRERRVEILPIAQHVLNRESAAHSIKARFAASAVILLARYPWPGNVRELENVVACGVARASYRRHFSGGASIAIPSEVNVTAADLGLIPPVAKACNVRGRVRPGPRSRFDESSALRERIRNSPDTNRALGEKLKCSRATVNRWRHKIAAGK